MEFRRENFSNSQGALCVDEFLTNPKGIIVTTRHGGSRGCALSTPGLSVDAWTDYYKRSRTMPLPMF